MVEQNLAVEPDQSGARALRIWDEGVTWRDLEPRRGDISWAKFDRVVANAQASKVQDVMYVFGSTPRWAAAKTTPNEIYGPGSASHPKNDEDFLNYVRQVVNRYKGRITSYQVWNEADIPDFYSGRPEQLAVLTAKTYRLIKSIDPSAQVAAAGLIPRPGRFGPGTFEDRYFTTLKSAGWPVDAYVFSIYPEGADPSLRGTYLAIAQQALQRLQSPAKPIWESELNYSSPNMRPFPIATQRRLVARSYIDSMGLGIERSYWYSWKSQLPQLGVRLTTPGGSATAAAQAYRTIVGWMAGKTWFGCSTTARVTRCELGPAKSTILYRSTGSIAQVAPVGSRQLCSLDGGCRSINAGTSFSVSTEPVLLRGG